MYNKQPSFIKPKIPHELPRFHARCNPILHFDNIQKSCSLPFWLPYQGDTKKLKKNSGFVDMTAMYINQECTPDINIIMWLGYMYKCKLSYSSGQQFLYYLTSISMCILDIFLFKHLPLMCWKNSYSSMECIPSVYIVFSNVYCLPVRLFQSLTDLVDFSR